MRALLAAALLALAVPAGAAAARFAVGVERGAPLREVAARVERATGGTVSTELAPLRALVLEAPRARGVAALAGVRWVERLDGAGRRLAFATNDPFVARQWYLEQDRAFDLWPEQPTLPGVRVAVIDSGIDGTHPEFAGRIAAARSFVGGSALKDTQGHGTFVAGEIAASINNGEGIAGIAFPAELMIAKVVRPDGTISLEAEAKAIRWAVDRGARVVNLSLGGVRDPIDPKRDTYSPLEQAAVEYAYTKGALVVAAVGNGDQTPSSPWPYASYPAALPHVLGVSALARDGSVPVFSNRDAVYDDIAAPGQDILSTLPLALTQDQTGCTEQGYSSCGPADYRHAEGTSFAAPQVTAAAALLLSVAPNLKPDQVSFLLERTATDANATNGCVRCGLLRDRFTGWGHLNVQAALTQALGGQLPPADAFESNDDAGDSASTLWGSARQITATLDFWDDQIDVYRLRLREGQQLAVSATGPPDTNTSLVLWRPGTERVEGLSSRVLQQQVRVSERPGSAERLFYRPISGGWYYLEVKLTTPGAGSYTLRVAKT